MKASKRLLIICLTAVMLVGMTIVTYADGNINYSGGVTDEMNKSEYWYDKTGVVPDQILMTKEEIEDLNKATIAAEGTNMYDLCNIESTYNAAALKTSLASASAGTRKYYVDGMLLDNEQYFGKLKEAIANTGFTDENREVLYAVSTKIANLKGWPTNDIIGYSSDDSDDEIQSAAMCVNEPFVIKQQCIVDGTTFYWGYSANCTGWVCGDSLAVCRTKEEWLDAWKVDVTGSDFLVVTEDKIILDKSVTTPYSSGLELNIGTCLKLVPKELIPDTIGERGTWNNYVVYLPVADENGNYVKKMALIPQHCNVSIGYPLLTQKNILDVAFSCLGNRYGWGGMLNSMDCSLYTRNVYRCFGLEIPRNTTWQKSVPGKSIDLTGKTSEEKAEIIKTLPAGSLFYIAGHTMIYTGNVNGTGYVISALGTVVDSVGPGNVINQYSVVLNSVEVRRRNGSTWLDNITTAVVFANPQDFGNALVMEDGFKVSTINNEDGSVIKRYFDEDNNLVRERTIKADKTSVETYYLSDCTLIIYYDENGKITNNEIIREERTITSENADGSRTIYSYTQQGTLTSAAIKCTNSYVIKTYLNINMAALYKFDEQGNLLSVRNIPENAKIEVDEQGNIIISRYKDSELLAYAIIKTDATATVHKFDNGVEVITEIDADGNVINPGEEESQELQLVDEDNMPVAPEDVVLIKTKINDEQLLDILKKELANTQTNMGEKSVAEFVDLSLRTSDGRIVRVNNGRIKITVPFDENIDISGYEVAMYHFDGEKLNKLDIIVGEDGIITETDGFSPYVITYLAKETQDSGNGGGSQGGIIGGGDNTSSVETGVKNPYMLYVTLIVLMFASGTVAVTMKKCSDYE